VPTHLALPGPRATLKDNVHDCVFLKDDPNRVKKGVNSYKLNFSLPTNLPTKFTELKLTNWPKATEIS